MRKSLLLLVLTAGMSNIGIAGETNSALAADQPSNLSCIVDEPAHNLRVLRDCENEFVPPPPVPEPYLTPSQIPIIGPHDGGAKSDRADRNDRQGGADRPDGPSGVN